MELAVVLSEAEPKLKASNFYTRYENRPSAAEALAAL
jgi:hypothetical protein